MLATLIVSSNSCNTNYFFPLGFRDPAKPVFYTVVDVNPVTGSIAVGGDCDKGSAYCSGGSPFVEVFTSDNKVQWSKHLVEANYDGAVQTLKYGPDGQHLIAIFPHSNKKEFTFAKLNPTTGFPIAVI